MSVAERRRVSARRDSLLGDEPGAFAVARFVRVTPQKARRVVDLVRGMSVDDALATPRVAPPSARGPPQEARRLAALVRGMSVDDALATLRFAPQAAAETVHKTLASAIANAETVESLDRASLVITKATVDEGPTLKRFRPRAQGRAYRIRKRTSHITLVVQPSNVTDRAAPGARAA